MVSNKFLNGGRKIAVILSVLGCLPLSAQDKGFEKSFWIQHSLSDSWAEGLSADREQKENKKPAFIDVFIVAQWGPLAKDGKIDIVNKFLLTTGGIMNQPKLNIDNGSIANRVLTSDKLTISSDALDDFNNIPPKNNSGKSNYIQFFIEMKIHMSTDYDASNKWIPVYNTGLSRILTLNEGEAVMKQLVSGGLIFKTGKMTWVDHNIERGELSILSAYRADSESKAPSSW